MLLSPGIRRSILAACLPSIVILAHRSTADPDIKIHPDIKSISFAESTVPGGGNSAVGIVHLTGRAPSGGVTVSLASASPGIADVPNTLTIPAGRMIAPFLIVTHPVSHATRVAIRSRSTPSCRAILTVRPISISTVTLGPSRISSGNPAAGSIELEAVAPEDIAIVLQCATPGVTLSPAHLVISKGGKRAAFQVIAPAVRATTYVTISAMAHGISRSAALTIVPSQ